MGRKAVENTEIAILKHFVEDTIAFYNFMAQNFNAICPMIFRERKAQYLASNLPTAGWTALMTQGDIDNKLFQTLRADPDLDFYSAHFIYKYGGLYKKLYCDLNVTT